MLIIYWDVRNLSDRIPTVRQLLSTHKPDLFVLANAWNYIKYFRNSPGRDMDGVPYDNWGLDTDGAPYNTLAFSARNASYGIFVIARDGVIDDTDYQYANTYLPDSPNNRFYALTTSDGFTITTVCAPTYGYKAARHAARRDFDSRLFEIARDTLAPNSKPTLLLGNFQVAHTDMDISWFLTSKTQQLVNPQLRANFQSILNLGYQDMFRAFNPAAGYYNAFRRSEDQAYVKNNIGARTTYAIAPNGLGERVTRCWHIPVFDSHYYPLAIHITPTDASKGESHEIHFTQPPALTPDAPIYPDTGSAVLYATINLNVPAYLHYAPRFQWFRDDENGTPQEVVDSEHVDGAFRRGGDITALYLSQLSPSTLGVYSLRVQNQFHTLWSERVGVFITAYPPEYYETPDAFGGYTDPSPSNPYVTGD